MLFFHSLNQLFLLLLLVPVLFFFLHVCFVLVLTNFGFPFSQKRIKLTPVSTLNLNMSDIKSLCVVGPERLCMSRLEACFVARPHRRLYNSFVCAIWRVKAGEAVAPAPQQRL